MDQEAAEFQRRSAGQLPQRFEEVISNLLQEANGKAETIATRKASGSEVGTCNGVPPGSWTATPAEPTSRTGRNAAGSSAKPDGWASRLRH